MVYTSQDKQFMSKTTHIWRWRTEKKTKRILSQFTAVLLSAMKDILFLCKCMTFHVTKQGQVCLSISWIWDGAHATTPYVNVLRSLVNCSIVVEQALPSMECCVWLFIVIWPWHIGDNSYLENKRLCKCFTGHPALLWIVCTSLGQFKMAIKTN